MTVEKLNKIQMQVVLHNASGTGGTDFTPNTFG